MKPWDNSSGVLPTATILCRQTRIRALNWLSLPMCYAAWLRSKLHWRHLPTTVDGERSIWNVPNSLDILVSLSRCQREEMRVREQNIAAAHPAQVFQVDVGRRTESIWSEFDPSWRNFAFKDQQQPPSNEVGRRTQQERRRPERALRHVVRHPTRSGWIDGFAAC